MLRDITSLLRSPQTRVWGLYAHGGQHMFSTILVFTLKFEFYYYSKYWQPFSWRDRSGFEKASAQLPAPGLGWAWLHQLFLPEIQHQHRKGRGLPGAHSLVWLERLGEHSHEL